MHGINPSEQPHFRKTQNMRFLLISHPLVVSPTMYINWSLPLRAEVEPSTLKSWLRPRTQRSEGAKEGPPKGR